MPKVRKIFMINNNFHDIAKKKYFSSDKKEFMNFSVEETQCNF